MAVRSNNGRRVATLTTRGTLRLWQPDAPGAVQLSSVTLDDETIESIVFSAEGSLILARTQGGHYYRWLTDVAQLDTEFPWLSPQPDTAAPPNARARTRP